MLLFGYLQNRARPVLAAHGEEWLVRGHIHDSGERSRTNRDRDGLRVVSRDEIDSALHSAEVTAIERDCQRVGPRGWGARLDGEGPKVGSGEAGEGRTARVGDHARFHGDRVGVVVGECLMQIDRRDIPGDDDRIVDKGSAADEACLGRHSQQKVGVAAAQVDGVHQRTLRVEYLHAAARAHGCRLVECDVERSVNADSRLLIPWPESDRSHRRYYEQRRGRTRNAAAGIAHHHVVRGRIRDLGIGNRKLARCRAWNQHAVLEPLVEQIAPRGLDGQACGIANRDRCVGRLDRDGGRRRNGAGADRQLHGVAGGATAGVGDDRRVAAGIAQLHVGEGERWSGCRGVSGDGLAILLPLVCELIAGRPDGHSDIAPHLHGEAGGLRLARDRRRSGEVLNLELGECDFRSEIRAPDPKGKIVE